MGESRGGDPEGGPAVDISSVSSVRLRNGRDLDLRGKPPFRPFHRHSQFQLSRRQVIKPVRRQDQPIMPSFIHRPKHIELSMPSLWIPQYIWLIPGAFVVIEVVLVVNDDNLGECG